MYEILFFLKNMDMDLKIEPGSQNKKHIEVPEIDLESMDLDFLGNPLKVGDTVILPYRNVDSSGSNNGRTILTIGTIKSKHIDTFNGLTIFSLKSDISSSVLDRLPSALIKVNVKPKEEKGTL